MKILAKNANLTSAAKAKNDEFYTQFDDIQRELNCYLEYDKNIFRDKTILLPCDDPEWSNFTKFFALNFNRYGMKKLISTSYATDSKKINFQPQISLFESESPQFDEKITNSRGKIFTLDRESIKTKNYPPDALQFNYLEGDGDFRSDEVKKLFAEADVIITNPPFSLFREFLKQILDFDKKFLIIGNVNAITYKEVFPQIMKNNLWIGPSIHSGDRKFFVPKDYPLNAATCGIDEDGNKFINVKGVRWFTNLEHGRRHQPLRLMTLKDNIKYSHHKEIKNIGYKKYDNYDAIEVPFTDAIPKDYDGVMGVPITFLDKYCPEQFEIIGLIADKRNENPAFIRGTPTYLDEGHKNYVGAVVNGKATYARVLIRRKSDS